MENEEKIVALIAVGAMIASMIPAISAYAAEGAGEAPDYSREECWYQLPEITEDVDTFYIYATEYADGSMEKGAPDFASLDNEEMLIGVTNQYLKQVSLFEDSTNVFIPLYRQAGNRIL